MGSVIKINPNKKRPSPINFRNDTRCQIDKRGGDSYGYNAIQMCFEAIAQKKYAKASAIISEIISCSKNSTEPSCINRCTLAAEYALEDITHYS